MGCGLSRLPVPCLFSQQHTSSKEDAQVCRASDIHSFVLVPVAVQADAQPAKASHLLVTVHRCEGLVMQQQQQRQGTPAVQRPYAHYTPPGRGVPHDTNIGVGAAPVFEDAASWGLVKSAAVMSVLQQHQLQVRVGGYVFFGRVGDCTFAEGV